MKRKKKSFLYYIGITFFILIEIGSCFFLIRDIRREYFSSRDKPEAIAYVEKTNLY